MISPESGASALLGFILVALTIGVILRTLIGKGLKVNLDIFDPCAYYGIFFAMYYLGPYLGMFSRGELPVGREGEIAGLMLTAYGGFFIGTHLTKRPPRPAEAWLEERESVALLGISIVSLILVAYFYSWRIANGIFFNQARSYEQEMTVAGSFRDVFIQNLQLPLIIMLGLLRVLPYERVARIANPLFRIYSVVLFGIFLLASQTRPAVTALLLMAAAARSFRGHALKGTHMTGLIGVGIVGVLFVQVGRVVSREDFAAADNQLLYALQNIVPAFFSRVQEFGGQIQENIEMRAYGGILFLAEIMATIEQGVSHLGGEVLASSLFSLIPRFLWPEKPMVVSAQIRIEELLHIPILYDAPASPINLFYAEWGWVGVFVGHLVFGIFLAGMTTWALKKRGMGPLIFLFLVWGQIPIVESELVIGVLGALRNALFLYVACRAAQFAMAHMRKTAASPRSAA